MLFKAGGILDTGADNAVELKKSAGVGVGVELEVEVVVGEMFTLEIPNAGVLTLEGSVAAVVMAVLELGVVETGVLEVEGLEAGAVALEVGLLVDALEVGGVTGEAGGVVGGVALEDGGVTLEDGGVTLLALTLVLMGGGNLKGLLRRKRDDFQKCGDES